MADQADHRLDRERPVVDQKGQGGGRGARHPDRALYAGQAGGMGEKASQAQPQAAQDGNEEAASSAAPQQEADLFDRLVRRSVPKQDILETEDRAQAFAQGAELA